MPAFGVRGAGHTPTRSLPARKGPPQLGPHSGDVSSAGPEVPPTEARDVGPSPVTAAPRHVLPRRPPAPSDVREDLQGVTCFSQAMAFDLRVQSRSLVTPRHAPVCMTTSEGLPASGRGHGAGQSHRPRPRAPRGLLTGGEFSWESYVIETSSDRPSERARRNRRLVSIHATVSIAF